MSVPTHDHTVLQLVRYTLRVARPGVVSSVATWDLVVLGDSVCIVPVCCFLCSTEQTLAWVGGVFSWAEGEGVCVCVCVGRIERKERKGEGGSC